jgi:chromosome partitioning protein
MMGSLSNFGLRQVLDVVGLSRQHTVVELHGDDGSPVASINVKGGHLVQSTADEADPREALGRALQAPESCTFHVFRLDEADDYHSFGQLVELLADEASMAKLTAPAAAGPVAAPAPAPKPVQAPGPKPVQAPASKPAATPTPGAPAPVPEPPIAAAAKPAGRTPVAVPRPEAATASAAGTAGVSLAVASPKGGVGKSTITLNLGISLAYRGLRVIIIDADINGDLLSLINARGSSEAGSFDLLADPGRLERSLRRTVVDGLRLLPAVGRELPRSALVPVDRTAQWRGLIGQALSLADIVLVDCPAGMSHVALEILKSVSHVLGVFQAETVASRSFEMFERGLATLGDAERPKVAGVVVNMLRGDAASTRVYKDLVTADKARRVLKTAINRSDAFEEAAAAATPVRLHGTDASRKLAWLFDNLALELASRLPLAQEPANPAQPFLL